MKHIQYMKLVNLRTRFALEKDEVKKGKLFKQIIKLERQIW